MAIAAGRKARLAMAEGDAVCRSCNLKLRSAPTDAAQEMGLALGTAVLGAEICLRRHEEEPGDEQAGAPHNATLCGTRTHSHHC